jgi:hypothetical protein
MPQISTSQSSMQVGAYDVFRNAFAPNFGELRRERTAKREAGDAALSKAIQHLKTMGASEGSRININNGVVTTNEKLDNFMQPQRVDRFRKAINEMQVKELRSAKQKDDDTINRFLGINQTDEIKNKILGADPKVSGGGGGVGNVELGENVLGSTSKSSNFQSSYSEGLGERSLSGAQADDLATLTSQQQFDDNFGRDTESARRYSMLNDIIATAQGKEYDPNKDVNLQAALTRDMTSQAAYAQDAQTSAAGTKYMPGNATTIGAGNYQSSLSKGGGTTTSTSVSSITPTDVTETYDIFDGMSNEAINQSYQIVNGKLKNNTVVPIEGTKFFRHFVEDGKRRQFENANKMMAEIKNIMPEYTKHIEGGKTLASEGELKKLLTNLNKYGMREKFEQSLPANKLKELEDFLNPDNKNLDVELPDWLKNVPALKWDVLGDKAAEFLPFYLDDPKTLFEDKTGVPVKLEYGQGVIDKSPWFGNNPGKFDVIGLKYFDGTSVNVMNDATKSKIR